eukprot:8613134-Pyramimonas_sp.AAC.1
MVEVPVLLAQAASPAGPSLMWTTDQMHCATERMATRRPTMIDGSLYAMYYGLQEPGNPLDNFFNSVVGSLPP